MRALAASSVRSRSGPVGLRWSPSADAEAPTARVAVGYAVAKRQGTAVMRNRMRRRARSIVAEASVGWPAGNYLLTLEAPVATMAYEELRDHVERAEAKLKR